MNNNNIKNLRQAMLSTAVAALVSIGFTACADETFMTQKSTAPADGYQVCIPANIGGGDTRAIAYNSESGGYDATFEATDEIYVYDVNKKAMGIGSLKPDTEGKNANLVGELTTFRGQSNQDVLPEVGEELLLFYKDVNFEYSHDFSNEWDRESDYALAKATITAISDGAIKTSPASFENYQSIYKINFTGIGSDVKIKKMQISSANYKLVRNCYPYNGNPDNFGNVTYTYKDEGTDQHELIFMLRFADNPDNESISGDMITFRALGSDDHNYVGTKSVTADLENGKYYHADLPMTDLGLALTLTNYTTGESVEINDWAQIQSKEAAYTLKNTGYNVSFGWNGGNNKLTLNGVTINNSNNTFLHIQTDSDDPDNTKDHNLVLDGENTIYSPQNGAPALYVNENCTLNISAASGSGKLTINGQGSNINLSRNAKVTIESGELILNGNLSYNDNSSFVITNNGKLRSIYDNPMVKAGSGYKLVSSKDGDYTIYTVTAADPYENPKTLSSATTDDIGKIIGSDGNIHVPNWDLPAGVSPVAMIANISSTGHGLAVAMDRVKLIHEIDHGWYYDESFTWNSAGENNKGKTATEIFDDWKANNNVTFGTWRFATTAEWQQMALDCGINGDANEAGDDMVAEGLVAILKQAGLFRDSFECWTGEFDTEGRITAAMLDNWYWDPENPEGYRGPYKLRFNYTDAEYINERYSNILPALEF